MEKRKRIINEETRRALVAQIVSVVFTKMENVEIKVWSELKEVDFHVFGKDDKDVTVCFKTVNVKYGDELQDISFMEEYNNAADFFNTACGLNFDKIVSTYKTPLGDF